MAPNERIRAAIHEKLTALIGSEEAAALMGMLPPERWTELATKRDLEALRVATKADIDDLHVATKADIEGLRGEMKADIEGLRGDVKADIEGLRGDVKTELDRHSAFIAQCTDLKLESVEARLRGEISGVRSEMLDLRGALVEQVAETRITLTEQLRDTCLKLVATLVPSMLVGVGLAFSAAKFS
ncbi:MAG: gp58-like family protein [Acidimicrobiia bacterium]|nr:gp58-like family protein [Acidimicrobiia bacterium]